MTAGLLREDRSQETESRSRPGAPVLALGLGNLLLGDDGVGLRLVERLAAGDSFGGAVEYIDGGTQGLALLGCLADREAVLVLDAVGLGGEPGTIHVLRGSAMEAIRTRRGSTAHEGNALELFATARVLGLTSKEVAVVGVEPENVRTGIGLSPRVEQAVNAALARAREVLEELVEAHRRESVVRE